MRHALESSKYFPIIAWTLVFGFAAFVYTLTIHVQAELGGLGDRTDQLEQRLNEMDGVKK